jgi:chorismate mutase
MRCCLDLIETSPAFFPGMVRWGIGPAMAEELEDLRAELARVDDALVAKIAERRAIVAKIASYKHRKRLPPFSAPAEAAREVRLRSSAAAHRLAFPLVEATLQPLFDDALRAQCAIAALDLAKREIRVCVAPKLSALGGGRFLDALEAVGATRVSDGAGAWLLQLSDEARPASDDEPAGEAWVTLSSPDPFRGRVLLQILRGDGAELRPLFDALGAEVDVAYLPAANAT